MKNPPDQKSSPMPEKIVAYQKTQSAYGEWIDAGCSYDLGNCRSAVYIRRDLCTAEAAVMTKEFEVFRQAMVAKVERLQKELTAYKSCSSTRTQPPALPDDSARGGDVSYLARDMDILAVILEKAPDAVDADFLRIKRVKNYIIQSSQREVTGEARYQCCAGGCENKVKNIGGICGDCFQSGCGETE